MSDLDRQAGGTEGSPDERQEREDARELAREIKNDRDDTEAAVHMTIAHVLYNRGLGHSLETCESLAEEIVAAVAAMGTEVAP